MFCAYLNRVVAIPVTIQPNNQPAALILANNLEVTIPVTILPNNPAASRPRHFLVAFQVFRRM